MQGSSSSSEQEAEAGSRNRLELDTAPPVERKLEVHTVAARRKDIRKMRRSWVDR